MELSYRSFCVRVPRAFANDDDDGPRDHARPAVFIQSMHVRDHGRRFFSYAARVPGRSGRYANPSRENRTDGREKKAKTKNTHKELKQNECGVLPPSRGIIICETRNESPTCPAAGALQR